MVNGDYFCPPETNDRNVPSEEIKSNLGKIADTTLDLGVSVGSKVWKLVSGVDSDVSHVRPDAYNEHRNGEYFTEL